MHQQPDRCRHRSSGFRMEGVDPARTAALQQRLQHGARHKAQAGGASASIPPGVVMSIASVKDRRLAPHSSNWFAVSIRRRSERARRSSVQVRKTSPSRTKARACVKPGRYVLAPEARSSKIRSHPASRNASSCGGISCTVVSTMNLEKSESFATPVIVATARLSCTRASFFSPMR